MPLSRRESDSFSDSVTISDFDDDKWGNQIGGYDESLPPPVQIVRHSVWVGDQEVVIDTEDMEKMLQTGWDDKAFAPKTSASRGCNSRNTRPRSTAIAFRRWTCLHPTEMPPQYPRSHRGTAGTCLARVGSRVATAATTRAATRWNVPPARVSTLV